MRTGTRAVLSSTVAPWVALVAGVLSQAVFTFGSSSSGSRVPWRSDWFWSGLWIESGCFPALLATSVAVAVDGMRTFAPARANLLASADLRGPFLRRYALLVAGAFGLPALGAFLLVAASWSEHLGGIQLWTLTHLLVALLSMCAVLLLGLAVALVAPLAALVVVPLATLWLGFTAMEQTGLLLIGTSTGPMLGYAPSPVSLLIQAITAVAVIAAAGLLVLRHSTGLRRGTGRPGLLGAATVALVVLLGASASLGLQEYRPTTADRGACTTDGRSPSTVSGGTPTACTSVQHQAFLEPLNEQVLQIRTAAAQVGALPSLPRTVVEGYTTFDEGATDPALKVSAQVAGWTADPEQLGQHRPRVTREEVVTAMTWPSHCPQMTAATAPGRRLDVLHDQARQALTVVAQTTRPRAERAAAAGRLAAAQRALRACAF